MIVRQLPAFHQSLALKCVGYMTYPTHYEPFYSKLSEPKVFPKAIEQECSAKLSSACNLMKVVNCGASYIDPPEAVVYVIPMGYSS